MAMEAPCYGSVVLMKIMLVCNTGKDQAYGLTQAGAGYRLISYALLGKNDSKPLRNIVSTGYSARFVTPIKLVGRGEK